MTRSPLNELRAAGYHRRPLVRPFGEHARTVAVDTAAYEAGRLARDLGKRCPCSACRSAIVSK